MRRGGASLVILVLTSCGDGGFERVAPTAASDVVVDRLCPASSSPDAVVDPVHIECALETGRFASAAVVPETLVVASYNVERGFAVDAQRVALEGGAIGARPDVLLLQEVDRGCSRTGFRNIARELAEALAMDYVFAVEFVELPRPSGAGGGITAPCEHGNAILSRFPLGNVGAVRHAANRSWYLPPSAREAPGEPRLGGRVFVFGEVELRGARLRAYSIHFEVDLDTGFELQVLEAREVLAHADAHAGPIVVGGDTNAATYSFDVANGAASDRTIRPYFTEGFEDAHAPLSASERGTRGGAILDVVLSRDAPAVDRGVCPDAVCATLSDHRAVWARVAPER